MVKLTPIANSPPPPKKKSKDSQGACSFYSFPSICEFFPPMCRIHFLMCAEVCAAVHHQETHTPAVGSADQPGGTVCRPHRPTGQLAVSRAPRYAGCRPGLVSPRPVGFPAVWFPREQPWRCSDGPRFHQCSLSPPHLPAHPVLGGWERFGLTGSSRLSAQVGQAVTATGLSALLREPLGTWIPLPLGAHARGWMARLLAQLFPSLVPGGGHAPRPRHGDPVAPLGWSLLVWQLPHVGGRGVAGAARRPLSMQPEPPPSMFLGLSWDVHPRCPPLLSACLA